MAVSSVMRVKSIIEGCTGKKVKFKMKKGKSKTQVNEGVILDTYPSVFTVCVEMKGFSRIVSFNYVDILINHVEFFVGDEMETKVV